jgi:hypothetical protein
MKTKPSQPGSVHVRPRKGAQVHLLDGPPVAPRQLLLFQPREKGFHLLEPRLVVDVRDAREAPLCSGTK